MTHHYNLLTVTMHTRLLRLGLQHASLTAYTYLSRRLPGGGEGRTRAQERALNTSARVLVAVPGSKEKGQIVYARPEPSLLPTCPDRVVRSSIGLRLEGIVYIVDSMLRGNT